MFLVRRQPQRSVIKLGGETRVHAGCSGAPTQAPLGIWSLRGRRVREDGGVCSSGLRSELVGGIAPEDTSFETTSCAARLQSLAPWLVSVRFMVPARRPPTLAAGSPANPWVMR